jgi:hypothetical protein
MSARRLRLRLLSLVVLAFTLAASGARADDLDDAQVVYEKHARHLLPERVTAVVDGVLSILELRRALPEMWNQLRRDPTLRAWMANLAKQYKPELVWSAYAGSLVESTTYASVAAGGAFDINAPLCRYFGSGIDSHAYYDGDDAGLAYDGSVRGCLPLGPFSIELGYRRRHGIRMGLRAAPTLPTGRFASENYELRIRSYRWLTQRWELAITPTDVEIGSVLGTVSATVADNLHFRVQSSALRFTRYEAGFLGEDRIIDGLHLQVIGQQDADDRDLNSNVIALSPVSLTGVRVAEHWYIDGAVSLLQARIAPVSASAEPHYNRFGFGANLSIRTGTPEWMAALAYRRGLIPDLEFRLLAEDRVEAEVTRMGQVESLRAGLFAAVTRLRAAPPGGQSLPATATYGADLGYGRYLYGPIYLSLRAQAARSFYARPGEAALLEPGFELRASAALAASWGSHH